jgi:hypothetical protein
MARRAKDAGDATPAGGKFPCRNPVGNPKCAGTCGKEGGLCRSCGIRRGKGSDGPRATSREPGMSLARPPAVVSPAPASRLPIPAVAVGDGPGPLTMALADFFAECGKASRRVEASMVLEGREMTVQVKFALP